MAGEKNFKILFFRHYDRKIAEGSITFSKLGISKDEFTKLCTEEGYVPDEEMVRSVWTEMKLTEEETKEMILTARGGRTVERSAQGEW